MLHNHPLFLHDRCVPPNKTYKNASVVARVIARVIVRFKKENYLILINLNNHPNNHPPEIGVFLLVLLGEHAGHVETEGDCAALTITRFWMTYLCTTPQPGQWCFLLLI